MNKLWKSLIALTLVYVSGPAESFYSTAHGQLYASLDVGVMQASINTQYLDQTDLIPQNISESISQNGYMGGLALGYTRLFSQHYFLGTELSAHVNGNSAIYESGAATAAFSDRIKLRNNLDLTVVPGIITSNSFFPYLKLGLSYASLHDQLTSPVGYNPAFTAYISSKNVFGFVAALGMKHALTEKIALFTEMNYHDFGTMNWLQFQNFSADYTHSAHVYSYGLILGALYAIDV